MFKAIWFVIKENVTNFYRTLSIARYEYLADMRDSKLGVFWNFASPVIQVFTYWFVFGYVFQRNDVDGIPYLVWMLGGMVVWFFINPCITGGCSAIYSKIDIVTHMKFPVSILPMVVVLEKLFDHFFVLIITFIVFAIFGYYPDIYWFGLLYYLLCAILFSVSLSMTTSVLTMLARDVRKFISSIMRMLFYMTPILWEVTRLPDWLQTIIKCNPMFYVVQGYRDCFFYHEGIMAYSWSMAWFWGITIGLFLLGSYFMYRFKTRFIDMV